jgi:alpha-L-rhamnosidase
MTNFIGSRNRRRQISSCVRIAIATIALVRPLDAQLLRVEPMKTEYRQNPVGIDVRAPRLSWRIEAQRRGTMQSAYQVRVATDTVSLTRAPLWDSGKIPSESSILRPYGGPATHSGTRYYWQVRVWDDAGRMSPWSAPGFWETGLLDPADWRARWITPDLSEDSSRANASPMLRREFSLAPAVASARLYVTSLGLNIVELNGERVSDWLFRPGWTSYDKRLQYDSYDVTAVVHSGANAIGVTLGDGWYRGHIGFEGKRNNYGKRLGLLAQLVVRYADGHTQVVITDENWKASTGPILMSDIYDGETYDARLEKSGWSRAGYDDRSWRGARRIENVPASLVAPVGPPVRRMRELKPVRILHTPAGETVFDLGQNMVGWVRLKVSGPAGTTVRLRHAEVLDKAGNFYTANLRDAAQAVRYTLNGKGVEIYEPHFSFQGFRYVAVDGFPGTPTPDAITGIVIYSDLAPTGTFETSNPLVNRLQQNIVWGQRGNFLDIPTDCPQRDERLGWTGDAQVFSRTAAFNMDVSGFFAKWLADVAADQHPDGAVPWVIPDVLGRTNPGFAASAGWSDVAVIVPWNVYQAYGDTSVLSRQYASMRAWVEYERAQAGPSFLWTKGFHFGDWLAFQTTRADYPGATTLWERWDGQKPASTVEDASMNSFNHYAYGAVGDWMYRVVAGLNNDPAEPGYKHIIVRPQPGGGFTYASATLLTPYGEAASGWKIEGNRFSVMVRVPANSHATVYLPGAKLGEVREGSSPLGSTSGVRGSTQIADVVVVEVGSGNYEFAYEAPTLSARVTPSASQ